jgi:hypothetical protein
MTKLPRLLLWRLVQAHPSLTRSVSA